MTYYSVAVWSINLVYMILNKTLDFFQNKKSREHLIIPRTLFVLENPYQFLNGEIYINLHM